MALHCTMQQQHTTTSRCDTTQAEQSPTAHKRIIIIGGGFGGLTVARALWEADVTLIDRTNHHLFQPLLYQVATAALSPGDIAWPFRSLFRSQPHVRVMMDEVVSIDRMARVVHLRKGMQIPFDILVIAPGSRHAYFGHDAWESWAPGLKTMTDAVQLRERMLRTFEEAEQASGNTLTQEQLTYVIVGGGPTGVELAGSLAEIGRRVLDKDFPSLPPDALSIILVEVGPRILSGFDPTLSMKATHALVRMGVTIKLDSPVSAIYDHGVMVGVEWIPSNNIIWAAGNKASPLLKTLSIPQDSADRIIIRPDLTIPDDPWIFVIGDAAHCQGKDGKPLPGVAPVAIQQGRYVASLINQGTVPKQRPPFVYKDRGMLATIGRAQAVAQFGPLHTSGLLAWLIWCFVHIFFLIGLRNRVRVMLEWVWYYLTFKPGAALLFERSESTRPISKGSIQE
ncbi:MAG: NAD(P)/FAD-dependent oxidoreductase [Nitrospira sp.]|nr:NAD(P)/FAD-dependent oxidoreductase [Nitrospira sp.]